MSDRDFIMYKRMAQLFSNGTHLSDIFNSVGIPHVYLYGIGEMGKIIIKDTKGTGIVLSAYDKSISMPKSIKYGVSDAINVYGPNDIPNDNVPILISPAFHVTDIISDLLAMGISRHRIITFNALLFLGWDIFVNKHQNGYRYGEKNFLIVGANFANKGSQAMSFVTMHEIRARFSQCNIWLCPNCWDEIYDKNAYKCIILRDGYGNGSTYKELLPCFDAIVDVSGYAIASIKNFDRTERVMGFIRDAYDFGISIYLMPQSFGPLNYSGYRIAEIRALLSYSKVIFARERSGEKLLKELGLKNVRKSFDMVLQASEVVKEDIYYCVKNANEKNKNYKELR